MRGQAAELREKHLRQTQCGGAVRQQAQVVAECSHPLPEACSQLASSGGDRFAADVVDLMNRHTDPSSLDGSFVDSSLQARIGSCRTCLFWLVARSLDAAQVTVMENILSANAPRVSVARTTNENVPRVVGVPVIRPGLAESCKPGGSCPERSVHVYPGTPPSANRLPQQ
jgi:hypothetical protein